MNKIIKYISIALIFMGSVSQAQQWDKGQTEVWEAVLGSYVDINNNDVNWTDKWVTADAMVWGGTNPMPRSRASSKRWSSYSMPLSKTLMSEYSPTAIVVHGSTAVAHYYYSNGAKSKEGKHKTTHGRCTDVLVKDKKAWKFLSWHCNDAPSGSGD